MAAEEKLSAAELSKKFEKFFKDYHLIGVRRDKKSYYDLTIDDLKAYPYCIYGLFLNRVMDGDFAQAEACMPLAEENSVPRLGMELAYPKTSLSRFKEILEYLQEKQTPVHSLVLTAGRPSVLNGLYDFTRIAPYMERDKERFIHYMEYIYEKPLCPAIYDLAIAEYYYQQDRLFDAGKLVTQIITQFDTDCQRRLLFAALCLQSKIMFANGKGLMAENYVKNIQRFVRKDGVQEFSFNIKAAETLVALYAADYEKVNKWMQDDAPDEFRDFNMLDLFRYMVKMRCYLLNEKYTALIALAEKLRPFIEAGWRGMDLCELDMLLAISFYRTGEKELAFSALERSLRIAKNRNFMRLIADEGEAVMPVLTDFIKNRGENAFLVKVVELARDMAITYPNYLRPQFKGRARFTKEEIQLLKLLELGKTKEEIADYFLISLNTVNYHLKKLYLRMGVNSSHQAIGKARFIGVL